jgi:hypothetical protein
MTMALYTSHVMPTVKPNPFQYLQTKSTIPKRLFLVSKIKVNFFVPFRCVSAVLMDYPAPFTNNSAKLPTPEKFRAIWVPHVHTEYVELMLLVRRLRIVYVANVLCPYVSERSNTHCSNKNFNWYL